MANEQNLKPVKNHEEAVERGRKGGLSKSPIQRWARVKKCNNKCPFYDSCPAITTSQTFPDKKCFIKSSPQEIRNYFTHLYCCGEIGLIKIIMDLHFRLLLKTGKEASAKALKESIETTLLLKKGIYGDKQKIEHSGNIPIQIIIERPEKNNDGTNTDDTLETN